MIPALRALTRRVAHTGVHDGMSPALQPGVVLTNVVAGIVLAVCVPYVLVHLVTGSGIRAILLAVEMALLTGVFMLNRRRRYLAARWLLLLTMDLSVGAVVATAGGGSLVWVCFIAVAAVSPLPFTSTERVHAGLGMALPVAIGMLGYSGALDPIATWLGEPAFPRLGEAVIVLGSMLIAPALVYWQASAKDRHVAELNEARALLEAENERAAELARALAQTSRQASEASRAKSLFLAQMSHEIRTPLAAVISLVDLAAEAQNPETRREYLDTAGDSAAQLLSILNDILDLSKVEQGDLALEEIPFDIEGLLDDVVRLARVRVDRPGVAVSASVDMQGQPWRLGDPLRLKQVLMNLLSNAVKFTDAGRIHVDAVCAGDVVRLEVSDTGSGMDRAQLTRVFDAFHQADPSITRTHGGTGLGLTISRHIVRKMGGTLLAESAPGEGSRFWFELELPRTGAPEVPEVALVSMPDTSPLRLLVAEDNAVNRMIAQRVLEQLGHQVVVVEDGLAALGVAFDGFDAVLMDVQMPVMDGLEATRRIRTIEAERDYSRVPIIALTANAMKGDREMCLEAGMDEHLSKPLERTRATEVLDRLTAGRLRKGA